MLFNFYSNKLGIIAEHDWFSGWQMDSESIILGKINNSRMNGIFDNYGLLGIYIQQIGLQGIGFSILDAITGTATIRVGIMYAINSGILTCIIFTVLYWIYKEFGIMSATVGYITTMYSNWIIVSARNLYWVTWTFLLPFLCILLLLYLEDKKKVYKTKWMCIAAFVTIFLRSACGYEFIPSIMIVTELPLIYYAIKNRWKFINYVRRAALIGLSAIAAFLFALIINLVQITAYLQSFPDAIEYMKMVIHKRTGFFNMVAESIIQESLDASLSSVILKYFIEGKEIIWGLRMVHIILIVIIFIALSFLSKKYSPTIAKNRNKLVALSATVGVSFFAPIFWFILAKGHAYHHLHINYMLWSLPFTILAFSLGGANVFYLLYDIWSGLIKKIKAFNY